MKARLPGMCVACAAFAATTACGSDIPKPLAAELNQNFTLTVGQELNITVQSVGPGRFEIPPGISSPVLQFISAAQTGVANPAGPTLLYRFRAVARGTAIITFAEISSASGRSTLYADTVSIR